MPEFKLPPVSPLGGSTISTFFNVFKGKRISRRYYSRIPVTVVLLLVCSLFHWIDKFYFLVRRKINTSSESPVFILGHWRSGTTFLHNLLACDPVSAYITTYHAVFPNNLKSQWLFRPIMKAFLPPGRPGDNMKLGVHMPQEDESALSNLTPMSYYHSFFFPGSYIDYYRDFVRFDGLPQSKIARWQKIYKTMVDTAIDNTGGHRPVLKNPVNTGRIRWLLQIYPDARFVYIMRNPIITYLSSKKFFSQLYPTVNFEEFSNRQVMEMVLDIYEKLLKDYLRDRDTIPPDNLIEIRYEDFEQEPIEQLAHIYSKFHLDNFTQVLPHFKTYLDTQKNYRGYQYKIKRWELDLVLSKLDFAMKIWNYDMPEDLIIMESSSDLAKKQPL